MDNISFWIYFVCIFLGFGISFFNSKINVKENIPLKKNLEICYYKKKKSNPNPNNKPKKNYIKIFFSWLNKKILFIIKLFTWQKLKYYMIWLFHYCKYNLLYIIGILYWCLIEFFSMLDRYPKIKTVIISLWVITCALLFYTSWIALDQAHCLDDFRSWYQNELILRCDSTDPTFGLVLEETRSQDTDIGKEIKRLGLLDNTLTPANAKVLRSYNTFDMIKNIDQMSDLKLFSVKSNGVLIQWPYRSITQHGYTDITVYEPTPLKFDFKEGDVYWANLPQEVKDTHLLIRDGKALPGLDRTFSQSTLYKGTTFKLEYPFREPWKDNSIFYIKNGCSFKPYNPYSNYQIDKPLYIKTNEGYHLLEGIKTSRIKGPNAHITTHTSYEGKIPYPLLKKH